MGACRYCGKPAGFLAKSHAGCRDRHDLVESKLSEFFPRFLNSALPADRFHDLAVQAADTGYISQEGLKQLALKGIQIMSDNDKLTREQAMRIIDLCAAFNLTDADFASH